MRFFSKEQAIEKEYHVSSYIIVYKFVLGLIEFLSGIILQFFGSGIFRLYEKSVIREISEDPHDLLARISENIIPSLLTHNAYIVIYLLVLGFAKILGSIGLIYKQNWGVDLLVGLTIIMAPFQIVSLIFHPNIFDLVYLVLGFFIALYLIEFKPKAWVSRMLKVIQ